MKPQVAILILVVASLSAAEPPRPFHDLPIAVPAPRPHTDLTTPHVASDGENFFALWSDFRAQNSDIYGARFSAAGELLDPEGRVIHATYENESDPVAIWNGADYVTFSNSGFLGGWNTLVSRDGEPRDAGADRLPQSAFPAAAAWSGSRYAQPFAIYNGDGFRAELVLRDNALNIVHRVVLAEETGISNVGPARVASDGSRFLVIWERQVEFDRVVQAAIVDGDGHIATPPFELARATTTTTWFGHWPDVAWNGTSYLVVMSAPDGLRAVPIAADGARGAEKLIAAGRFVHPAIAWDGHAHLVLWNVYSATFAGVATRGAILTATGDPVETFDVLDRAAHRPAIASNGDVFFALVANETFVFRSTGPERIARRGGPATFAYKRQSSPVIAAGETNLLTAWVENGTALWIGRLSRRGEPLDGSGVQIAAGSFVSSLLVYAAGGFYVVAWVNSPGEVRIARVTAGGEVVDPGGIVLASSGTLPVVAWNGRETRMVWGQRPSNSGLPLLMSATLQERGPIGTPAQLLAPRSTTAAMDLVPNGDAFTLLFEVLIPPACPQPRFCAVEFEYQSLVIDAAGTPSSPVLVAPRGLFFDAAADERSIVITWYEGPSQRTRRLGLDGLPAGEVIELALVPAPLQFPRFERTANGFVLILNRAPVQVVHLDRDGRPLTTPATLLDGDEATVSGTAYAGGQTWLAYTTAWRPLPNAHNGGVSRAWVHVLGPRRRAAR